jgi:hypothetical protein
MSRCLMAGRPHSCTTFHQMQSRTTGRGLRKLIKRRTRKRLRRKTEMGITRQQIAKGLRIRAEKATTPESRQYLLDRAAQLESQSQSSQRKPQENEAPQPEASFVEQPKSREDLKELLLNVLNRMAEGVPPNISGVCHNGLHELCGVECQCSCHGTVAE